MRVTRLTVLRILLVIEVVCAGLAVRWAIRTHRHSVEAQRPGRGVGGSGTSAPCGP